MADRVNVTSVEAIDEFRGNLIVYVTKARPTLEEVNAEITRTRVWLESTQRTSWEAIAKKRARVLEEAKAALFSARIKNLGDATAAEVQAVTKAKRAHDEAEEKLRMIRKWGKEFDNRAEPLARQLEKLHSLLAEDLGNAIIFLSQAVTTLRDYADMIAPSLAPNTPQPSAAEKAKNPIPGSGTEGGTQ